MNGNFLLISSAALHAFWNALVKKTGDPRVSLIVALSVSLLFTAVILPFSALPYFACSESFWWAIAAGFFEGGYLVCLAIALEVTSMGTTYVISRGGAMLVVWLFSTSLLGEEITRHTILGSILVLTGIILTHPKSETKVTTKNKYAWAYLCAFFIAGYHLFYGQALKTGASPYPLFLLSLGIGLPIYLFSCDKEIFHRIVPTTKKFPAVLLIGGICCSLSFLVFLKGLSYAGPGVAITLRNTSVIFAQVFAFWIGERPHKTQWVGALLVAIGAVFISL